MRVAVIGASHSDMPFPSQHSHAAMTQRVAVNLAWRKHGFKLKEGSDVATSPVRASSSTSQTKRHKTNMEITHMTWCALKENRHLENISVLAMKCGEVILKDT